MTSAHASLSKKNQRTVSVLLAIVALMTSLAWFSVPLYRLFCQVTGFAGTPRVVEGMATTPTVEGRNVTVRFESSISRDLHWTFRPSQKSVTVPAGRRSLAFYEARNIGRQQTSGHAVFNVTPLKAAQYFVKVECFCFVEQSLAAGANVSMPVAFYIDPAIEDDKNMDDVTVITLSYTFYASIADDT